MQIVRNDDGLEPEYTFEDGVFESKQRNIRVDLRGHAVKEITVTDFAAVYVDSPCKIIMGDNCKVHIVDSCILYPQRNCWIWGYKDSVFHGGENSYFIVGSGNSFVGGKNNRYIINGINTFNVTLDNFIAKSKRKSTIAVKVPVGECFVNRIEPKHLSDDQVAAMKKDKELKKILNKREDSLLYSRDGIEYNKIPEKIAF